MGLIADSQQLLHNGKLGILSVEDVKAFEKYKWQQLTRELYNDQLKKTFWMNLYNALVILRVKNQIPKSRGFYSQKMLNIASVELSLDDIEHGILRRSKVKWALGFVQKIKVPLWEREFRVSTIDPRIHFALNCGANSCPPISIYHPENIDEELDKSTYEYLNESTVVSSCLKKVKIPRIFLWYLGDFSGLKGVRSIYYKYGIIPPDVLPSFSFLNYDWSLNTQNFNE